MSQSSTLATSTTPLRLAITPTAAPRMVHDQHRCVSCGACVAHCAVAALVVDSAYRVTFSASACRGCTLCLPACAYGALALALPGTEQHS